VKDLAPDGGDAPVGEGALPWPGLLAAADRAGVEWLVVEQDHPHDPAADVATSLANLTRLL
jgi:sugar phosphate isomerase/epimerase